MKKILLPVKRVPDYEIKLKVNSSGDNVETGGIKWIMNPFDEIAVEEGVRLKENSAEYKDAELIVLSIGPSECSEQIRTALAMGADRGILVESNTPIDSWCAHKAISQIVKKEDISLVIMGKQSIDSDANQTGQLLAAELGWPQATFASEVKVIDGGDGLEVTREVDGGLESLSLKLPAVITSDLRLNEPRYPSLPGIVKAKKKPLDTLTLESLGLSDSDNLIKLHSVSLPPDRKAGVKVESVKELVEKLQNEAKVI